MKKKFAWPLLLALFALTYALTRWPGLMPPNFSATYAILFCAGVYLPGRLGLALPLGVVVIATDVVLTAFFYKANFHLGQFLGAQLPNYLAYAGLFWLGRQFGSKRPWWALAGGGLLGALLFYIVTNTAAWMELSYTKTLAGWIQAITTGLPGYPPTWEFFRNTLMSGGLFTGLYVGAMKLAEQAESQEETKTAEEPDQASPEPSKVES